MSSKTFLIWYKFYKFYTFTCKFWDECCTSSTSSIRFGVWLRHWHDRRDDKQRRQHQVVKQTEHIRRSYRCVTKKRPFCVSCLPATCPPIPPHSMLMLWPPGDLDENGRFFRTAQTTQPTCAFNFEVVGVRGMVVDALFGWAFFFVTHRYDLRMCSVCLTT